MKRITFLMISSLLVSIVLSNGAKTNTKTEVPLEIEKQNYTLTVGDMAAYLQTKEEHYPHSDEFIERYQQKSGGYIDLARSKGMVVDKRLHLPNQKWHFFDSWLALTYESTPDIYEQSAKTRVYTYLLCPELLLWIYEACEVDPVKVKLAKAEAEYYKTNKEGMAMTTMAKNMRECVPWEDLESTVLAWMAENG